ncbi:MAG: FtsH protease activity modulator HflK [Gammaproteobacteria bacterium]|nr:FtsH protease activity modulator HflK [Gammaproteobacteria bacterium]TVQ46741.1 MAG: FtsH protease activity modulator HflK [Gammaproteobacteria bacterium]
MSWNESGNNKNPWNQGGGDKGPPDLDQVVRDLQRRLSSVFGGKRGGGDGAGRTGGSGGGIGPGLIVGAALVVWLLTGFYKVDDSERGVVMTFGEYSTTTLPGLHWRIPFPVQTVEKINVSQVDRFPLRMRMLTRDETLVQVDLAVQFRRTDPVAFLFNVRNPEETLADVAESAIREVIGKNDLDFILTEGRAEVAQRTQQVIQSTLNAYGTGIEVTQVNLQEANFPQQVQAAVQDAIKAREDFERLQLEAQAYANDIVPRARGAAARQIEDAMAYRDRLIAVADGEADRFVNLLAAYEQAPAVTRQRLYLETMEEVLGRASKVIMDTEGSGNLLYLPMDKLLERRGTTAERAGTRDSQASIRPLPLPESTTDGRDDRRARVIR